MSRPVLAARREHWRGTAVTRARRLCVIVGSRRAIAMAVKNDKIAARHSALAERLRGGGVTSAPRRTAE